MNATTNKTNDLRVNITTKDIEGNDLYIKIRLNDECKNGHQDFSITGNIYEAGKKQIDKYFIAGGCIHEDILAVRPDLKIFVDLHLCDYSGVPMHAVANGFYHLTEGFNTEKPNTPEFKIKYCEYYRVTPSQFDVLAQTKNKIQFGLKLIELGVLSQWEAQAKEAIKLLEEWTGKEFVNDSKRSQFITPTSEEIAEEEKRQKEGYYTEEAERKREEAAVKKIVDKLEKAAAEKIKKIKIELDISKQVLFIGGQKALDNFIFYSHSMEIAFNWKSYSQIDQELIEKLKKEIILPEGVTYSNK